MNTSNLNFLLGPTLFELAARTLLVSCLLSAWNSLALGQAVSQHQVARGSSVTPDAASSIVEVVVDVTQGLNLGGSRSLRRDAYFNIHGTPGELSQQESKHLLGTLRASMGRSMGTISSFMGGLKEDPKRPGFADQQVLMERVERYIARQRKRPTTYAQNVQIVHSVHPFSYYGKSEDEEEKRARFVPGSHEAAAEILAAFFSRLDLEREPYFEVANEGNVHVRQLGTTMEDLCDLHSVVARKLHEEVPGLKIGGPASAWPAFEFKEFQIWRDQMGLFIDRVGKDMDFLSVHLYTTHYDDKTNDRFGANIDAILDLMENKSLLSTGEVKPLLISECGTGLKKGERIMEEYSPHRDWLILRGANHVFMNLLRRDDRIVKMIPFIVLKASWYDSEFPYPWTLFHRHGDSWVPTHLSKWYEFWKDIQGRHLRTTCSSLDVQTHAVLDGNIVYLCLDNLLSSEQELTVRKILGEGLQVESSSISRLFFDGSQPTLSANVPLKDLRSSITLRPHEAAIVRVELSEAPQLDSDLVETTYYGGQILREITEKPAFFAVESPVNKIAVASALLRIGVGRAKSLPIEPRVRFNGQLLAVPDDIRGESLLVGDDVFVTKEFEVPIGLLRKKNRISVRFAEPGGHVSSVVLIVRETHPSPSPEVAAANLEAARAKPAAR